MVRRVGRVLTTMALAVAGCATAGGGAAPSAEPGGPVAVQVSLSHCGEGWTHASAGVTSFRLRNTGINAGEAYLIVAATGEVVAEVEGLGPGASAALTVRLGDGAYAFRCVMEDSVAATGPTVVLSGPPAVPGDSPAVAPVGQADMIGPTKQYEGYVMARLPGLAAAVRGLRADIAADHLAAAKESWLSAHLDYERLGAAYGAFGDVDAAINGLPFGLPGGVGDPQFDGFHRIEYGLWHGQSAAVLAPIADRLVADVEGLVRAFPTAEIDPLQVAIRAHEITENSLQFEMTGRSDFGSGDNLATVRANLDGTDELITILTPLLAPRYPALPALRSRLRQAINDVDAQHGGTGWTPITGLSRAERERLDADISALTELLAPVASILAPRRTS